MSTDHTTYPDPGPDGTPIGELIARREHERAVNAAEEADNGWRLVAAMERELLSIAEPDAVRFDGLGADPAPEIEIDDELIGQVADKVGHFRTEAAHELRALDKHAPRHVYVEALALVAQMDEFLAAVADHFRGQS